jgi:two-component system chemotaxis response regulator CheB
LVDRPPQLNLVVLGASAGGVGALCAVVAGLPPGLLAAVLVVLHISPAAPSLLGQILDRASALPGSAARDGEPLMAGRIYAAPPDRHLTVDDSTVRLTSGERINGNRPAIDALFCSAADHHGAGVVGIVLSGTLHDGTAGLARIKACGGATIVQDPDDAEYDEMPDSAIEHVAVDAILPVAEIGRAVSAFIARGSSARALVDLRHASTR